MNGRIALVSLAVALVAAACSVDRPPPTGASGAESLPAVEQPSGPSPTDAPASAVPGPTDAPGTEVPAATAPPTPTPTPAPEPTPAPGASGEPAATPGPAGCTGSADNLDFLGRAARDLDWTVLCAVLPKGWNVHNGSYRLANGGTLLMAYESRAGATLDLSEGAFCTQADGCVPPGTDVGEAALGPFAGTLVALDDGGWAIVAARGEEISWLLEAHGVDEAAVRSFGAALAEVRG